MFHEKLQTHEAEVAQEQAVKQAEAARAEQARLAEAVAAAEVIPLVLQFWIQTDALRTYHFRPSIGERPQTLFTSCA